MGFYLNILLLTPREQDFNIFYGDSRKKQPERKCTLWETETIINLQRISAPVNDAGFSSKTARERASLHFFNSFFGKLNERVNEGEKESLLPPFAILPAKKSDRFDTYSEWQKKFVTVKGDRNWFVKPLGSLSIDSQIPSQRTMEEHNGALKEGKGHRTTSDIVMKKPLVWAPCELLGEWISEGEKAQTFVSLKNDDHAAVAYFAMWKSCIAEMGKVGARALFLFDSLHITTIV